MSVTGTSRPDLTDLTDMRTIRYWVQRWAAADRCKCCRDEYGDGACRCSCDDKEAAL